MEPGEANDSVIPLLQHHEIVAKLSGGPAFVAINV